MEQWHNEYLELMFGPGHTLETMSKAADIKYQHMPERLYKYRPISENTIAALRGDYLISSPPRIFNDMFEGSLLIDKANVNANTCQRTYDNLRESHPFLPEASVWSLEEMLDAIAKGFGGSIADLKNDFLYYSLMQQLIESAESKLNADIAKIQSMNRNLYNIVCLSELRDSKLMWTHYADNSSGFCIGYDIKSMGILNPIVGCTMPVVYMDNPSMTVNDIDQLNGSQAMHLLSCKGMDWEYEKEWRIFYIANEEPRREAMPIPKEIYLGPRISHDNKRMMTEICVEKGIHLYQMVVNIESQKYIPERML